MEIINVTDEIIEINVTEAVVNVVTQNGAYPLPSNVFSVFGRVGNVVGQVGDYTTSLVTEGTNLYYTDARSRAAISENITGLEYSSASGIFTLASGYLIPTQAMLDAKVPYTGATGNVTLGEYQLTAGQVTFDQTPTGTAGVGVLRWNNTDGTLDLGLKGGNVTLQIGQEQVKRVVNGAGVNLTEAAYQVVRVSGAQGQRLQVVLAQANNDQNSATTLGIVTENINNNQEGFITTSGEVRDINTTGSLQGETWADGDVLYLSPTTAGRITNIKPVAPNHMVIVGYVEYAHQNNGKIFVKVDNGYELDELHNVKITDPLNNQALIFDSTDSVWKNESIASAIGYTPANAATLISTTAPLTGGGDLSANRTLSMPAATTSANGYLTSTDWNTFNNKENFLASGTTAQYYRGDKTFQTLNTTAVAEGTNLYYTQARFDTAFGNKSTTNLTEGTNLYYTDARARAAITGTAPISVTSGVVSISQAGGAANGFLSSTDWTTFNNKQAALNGTGFVKISGTTISYDNNTYLTTISGIAAGGELSGTYANPTLVNNAVTGKVLTGLNLTGGGTIADTDSILGAFGKVQNQISALVGGVMYEGTWNASTNTPTIVSSVGSKGDYYIVATAGSTNINGITSWNVGDWIIFNGTTWDKVDNTDAVSSVNGYTGAVSLVTSDVPESGSLYFTNARAIGSTLTGYTSGSGVVAATDTILQAIQKLNGNVSGLVTGVSSVFGRTGAVVAASGDYTTTQVTEGTNLYYTEARVNANANVAANTAARHAAVTIGTANGLSLSTQALSLAAASASTTGALTSTDWNTFNGKQNALTNPVTGTGTTNYLPKFTGASTIGNSIISESGSVITIAGNLNVGASGSLSINAGTAATPLLTQSTNYTEIYRRSGGVGIYLGGTGDAANYYDNATHYFRSSGGGSTYATINASGNLGLGVTPSAWAFYKALQVQAASIANFDNADNTIIGSNVFYGGSPSDFRYISTGTSTMYRLNSGIHTWWNAPSGTAGNAISFTQAMTLASTGNLLIGTTTDAGYKLDVNGTTRVLGSTSSILYIEGNSGNSKNIFFKSTGAADNSIRLYQDGGTNNFIIATGDGTVAPTNRLTIASTGAATFSGALDVRNANSYFGSQKGYVYIFEDQINSYFSSDADATLNINYFGFNQGTTRFRSFDVYNGKAGKILGLNGATGAATFSSNVTTNANNFFNNTSGRAFDATSDGVLMAKNGGAHNIIFGDGNVRYYSLYTPSGAAYGSIRNFSTSTDILSFTSGGNVLIGTTTDSATTGVGSKFVSLGRLYTVSSLNDNTQESLSMYSTGSSAYRFYVGWGGTVYATNTTISAISDIRFKENIQDIDLGLDAILALKPRKFDWKEGKGKNIKNDRGFIAQEFEQIFPDLIDEWKDPSPEGEEPYKSVRQDLIPILVKAIQELKLEIEELKALINK